MQINHSVNLVELKNISFSYGKDAVLQKINLNIHRGDYLGIIGPNGGGKTTLVRLILGLIKPDSGTVTLFNEDINRFRAWPKIGYVPQKATNYDGNFPATVYEVASMGRFGRLGFFRNMRNHDKEAVNRALESVGMSGYRNRIISSLSGGQQQRVFIARALASEPEIIILDEPTVGVDAHTQDSFYKLLKKLNRTLNLTLVLVSHDIEMVARETTEIACVNRTLIYDKDPRDFLKSGKITQTYGRETKLVFHNH